MFSKQEFIKSAFKLSEIPKVRLPEVILCGRSNVGKSSFINSFFNRKNLAKVSSTPGKTRSINFYLIDETFYVVDLPGYGYAKTSKSERENWSKLITDFVSSSRHIKLALHFIDSRHKPSELDIELNRMLHEYNLPYILLLSKSDKLKQSDFSVAVKNLKEHFPNLDVSSNVIFYSTVKVKGKKELTNLFSEIFY